MAVLRIPTFQDNVFFRGAAAALCVLAAFLITTQVDAIAARTPFAFFYASVALVTWIGGRHIGFVTLILSAIAGGYFIIPPENGSVPDIAGVLQLATFVLVGLLFVFLTSRLKLGTAMFRESEARYRTLFEYSPYGILIADQNSNYIDANNRMCRMLGYAHRELVGMHATDIVAPHETPEIDFALETIRSGADHVREWRFRRKDGSEFIGEVVATEMPDGTLLGVVRDVTERERAEERFRQVIEGAPNGMVMVDAEGRIQLVNAGVEKLFGYDRKELLGRAIETLVPHRFRPRHEDYRRKFIAAPSARPMGSGRDLFGLRKDGSEFPVEIGLNPIETDSGIRILGTIVDTTERKRAEESLRRSQERLKAIVDTALDGIIMMDHEGRIVSFNPAAERIFKYESDDVVGQSLADKIIPPSLREAHRRGLERLLATGEASVLGKRLELTGLRSDGSEMPVELAISRVGTTDPPLFTGFVRDISDRKQAEASLLRSQQELERRVAERTAELEQANKELESFSYSVSHDLRAPLRHIDGFLSLLADRESESFDETSKRYVAVVSAAVVKMGRLIDELLAFSRTSRQELHSERIDLNGLVKESLNVLDPSATSRSIKWRVEPLPYVLGDPTLLGLVFSNLLSNAVKFTRHRDTAEIEVGSIEERNGNVVIYVKDNGVGFDMAYSRKLFGVFQRLHREDEFEGIGIGLATVQRIVSRHGGRVWAEAEADKGATFYFSLKRAH